MEDLLIWEVLPSTDREFITIRNVSPSTLDLEGFSVSDGEGKSTFGAGFFIQAGQSITITRSESLMPIGLEGMTVSFNDPEIETSGNLRLADSGDQVVLMRDQKIVDVLVYGNVEILDGWDGSPFPKPGRGDSILRMSIADSNTSKDWMDWVPGRSSLDQLETTGRVEPILSPDDMREMVWREIHFATRSIHISVYQMDDPIVVAEICRKASSGVDVIVLLEGQPVGGLDREGKESIGMMLENGADVRLMKSDDGYKRYRYLHCKMGIFDSSRALILSENMLSSSFDSNRGWGVSVESVELARYLERMFIEDSNPSRIDVGVASIQQYPCSFDVDPEDNYPPSIHPDPTSCSVRTLISPDHTIPSLLELIQGSRERIDIEQLYLKLSLDNCLVRELVNASLRGIRVRLLLDSTFLFGDDADEQRDMVKSLEKDGIEIRYVSEYHDFDIIHNKGMIVDDSVVISSINLCEGALTENREVGLIIESGQLANSFSSIFESDWAEDPFPPMVMIDGPSTAGPDEMIILSGANSTDNAGIQSFQWSIDGIPMKEGETPVMVTRLGPGIHEVILEVTDIFGNKGSGDLTISIGSRENNVSCTVLIPCFVIPIPFLILLLKRIKHGKRH
jgi:phosphatidylserine/phosphatidylglycerophosphate/cardiolipin synthase-like enzyme